MDELDRGDLAVHLRAVRMFAPLVGRGAEFGLVLARVRLLYTVHRRSQQ